MATVNNRTEELHVEVLHEVREMRHILETDEGAFDNLEDYENPDHFLTSLTEAKKLHGEPQA